MSTPTPESILQGLAAGPDWYPFQVNWPLRQAWMLEASEEFYRDAAFLDQRALAPQRRGLWLPLAALADAISAAPSRPLGLLFHVGHCGSTLLSRALGLAPPFFVLREPLPLRDLAGFHAEAGAVWSPLSPDEAWRHAQTLRALWTRTPRAGQRAVVKATSFCSALAADWLARHVADRAVLLAMAPEKFIATVLGAPEYVADLVGGAKVRMCALRATTAADLAPLHSMSPGEVAAMTVLAELVNLDRAAALSGERALRVDFDAYLARPADTLQAIARHFGVVLPVEAVDAILRDPLMRRYSKATDYAFSAAEREQRLRESRAARGAEIQRGLRWLDGFAAAHTTAAGALERFGYCP